MFLGQNDPGDWRLAPYRDASAWKERIVSRKIDPSGLVAKAIIEETQGNEFGKVRLTGVDCEVDWRAVFFEELEGPLDDVTAAAFDVNFQEDGRGLGREEAGGRDALDF